MPTRVLIARHDHRALQGGGRRAWGQWVHVGGGEGAMVEGRQSWGLLGGAEESWVCWRQAAGGRRQLGSRGDWCPPASVFNEYVFNEYD